MDNPTNIPNLDLVDTSLNLWRGGQPTSDGFQWLYAQGVRHVVKLNEESEGTDVAAEALGMNVVYVPITLYQQVLEQPTKDQIERAVAAVGEYGTFVHCEHGQDRTGLVIGVWRVRSGFTPKNLARVEMDDHGFHWQLLGLSLYWDLHV